MVFDVYSDVFAVIGGFVFHCFINAMLGEEDFECGEASGKADEKEDKCREGGEKRRIEVNQQAKTNEEQSCGEYAACDFARGLGNHIGIELERHF